MQPRILFNFKAAQTLLLKAKKHAADLTPVFEGPIANKVHVMFAKIFSSEGSYIGSKWPALAFSTIQAKARIGRSKMGILRRFNTLWASLVKRGHPLGYRIVTPKSLLIGTSVPYAAPHQLGAGHLPTRIIAPPSERVPAADIKQWTELVVQHIESFA